MDDVLHGIAGDAALRELGIEIREQIPGGEQSLVASAQRAGERYVAKFTDARFADAELLRRRCAFVEGLASEHHGVVAPVRIEGSLVHRVDGWWMTVFPFVDGAALDGSDPVDAHRIGSELARLHGALARCPLHGLGAVAALERIGATDTGSWQPLHGDFSTKNLLVDETGVRILDFDDCGMGPSAYDVANSLYMDLFDAFVTDDRSRHEAFREAFLDGYRGDPGSSVSDEEVDRLMSVRIDALALWLDDLDSAPVGIRLASPEWHATLADFIRGVRG